MYIAPVITSSPMRLVMLCTNKNPEAEKRVKLVNKSKVTAIFMFDINQIEKSFTVDISYGQIEPHSRKYVTITFAPRQIGVHACHLPCLILNHVKILNFYIITLINASEVNPASCTARL